MRRTIELILEPPLDHYYSTHPLLLLLIKQLILECIDRTTLHRKSLFQSSAMPDGIALLHTLHTTWQSKHALSCHSRSQVAEDMEAIFWITETTMCDGYLAAILNLIC